MNIYSFSPFGYEGSLVQIEVDLRRGIPAVDLVGLADSAVKESRERMRSAIRNSGFEFPPERVLISLSPADLKKEGAGFDLPLAIAVLCESLKEKVSFIDEDILIMGELELNGNIKPVRAVHAASATAVSSGIGMCIVPVENADEAREAGAMKVFGASCLTDAFNAMSSPQMFSFKNKKNSTDSDYPEDSVNINGIMFPSVEDGFDYCDVHGQKKLIRGLQIAAAGGHNLLAYGPPGCGKTLSLQKFPSLLPFLTPDEAGSTTRIYSVAGLLSHGKAIMNRAPFRQPHQTATIEGICGGGSQCRPGEISLSHNGVLFLDEAAEFKTSVLQMLRVPVESKSITISRAGRTSIFPAKFQLLMSTNPCPCGNYGSKDRLCLCSARAIEQYWRKFSGPLLDRIDLRIKVDVDNKDKERSVSSEVLRRDIGKAIMIQRKRQGCKNADLTPSQTGIYCTMTEEARTFLDETAERNELSPRAVASCIKVARTICDMNGGDLIDRECINEAVQFRCSASGSIDLFNL